MDSGSLILLGLLMAQSQHGYQINEFIETNLNMVTDMKKPTAYAKLERLSKQGYVDVSTEQEGNRPVRKVYSINEMGKQHFHELLVENLSSAEAIHYTGDIGLMFIDHLSPKDAVSALRKRLDKSLSLLEEYKKAPDHGTAAGVNLAVKHKIAVFETEIDFIRQTLEQYLRQMQPDHR